jgi:hypothetical protein
MHTDQQSPTSRAPRRASAGVAGVGGLAGLVVAVALTTGCVGNLVHSYGSFRSALERGASCSELFDQRGLFDDAETLAKIDRDLERIGCSSPDAIRNDR